MGRPTQSARERPLSSWTMSTMTAKTRRRWMVEPAMLPSKPSSQSTSKITRMVQSMWGTVLSGVVPGQISHPRNPSPPQGAAARRAVRSLVSLNDGQKGARSRPEPQHEEARDRASEDEGQEAEEQAQVGPVDLAADREDPGHREHGDREADTGNDDQHRLGVGEHAVARHRDLLHWYLARSANHGPSRNQPA